MTSSPDNPVAIMHAVYSDVQHNAEEMALLLAPERAENKFFRNESRAVVENYIQEALRQLPNGAELTADAIFGVMRAAQ